MKKFLCLILIVVSMLTCGITFLCTKIDYVKADYIGTDGANFVLTGYSGYSPSSYFSDSTGNSRLVNAQAVSPDKNYLNQKGTATKKYNYITGNNSSLTKEKCSGYAEIYPGAEMQELISSGQMSVKASCGLLALADNSRSKVEITIKIIAGGSDYKILKLSSNKVSNNSSQYEPDWVSTDLVDLPTNTEKIVFSFTNLDEANLVSAAKFCIFEPTVFFATKLSSLTMQTTDQSIKAGQVLKLNATNYFSSNTSSTEYMNYYRNIHSISYEITEGSSFGQIVGSYLYVNDNAPENAVIKVRAKCRQSSANANYIYSNSVRFTLNTKQTTISIQTDFSNPATLGGQGKYYVGDYATLTVSANKDFTFAGWQINGEVVSTNTSYTFAVAENQQIKALFKKSISISSIVIDNKIYDGTTTASINKVNLSEVESAHEVKVSGLTASFATSSAGENKAVTISSTPILCGKNSSLYVLKNSAFPQTTATISKKSLTITSEQSSKIYGETDGVLKYTSQGLVSGESLKGNLSRESGESVGEYKTTIGTLAQQNPNYDINFIENKFTITKRPLNLLQTNVETKIYDKTTSAQVNVTFSNKLSSDDLSIVVYAKFEDSNVGSSKNVLIEKFEIIGDNSENYYIENQPSNLKGNIDKKSINIYAENKNICYGDELNIKYSTTELIEGDVLSGELSILDKNVGKHLIVVGTLNNPNYSLMLNEAFVTVEQKNITLTINNKSKIYGDSDPDFDFVVDYIVEGDTISGVPQREDGESVGEYVISKGTLSNKNYNITFVEGKLTISQRSLIVNFEVEDKEYDGTVVAKYNYSLVNALTKDNLQIIATLEFNSKDVEENKLIIIKNLELNGNNKENYYLDLKNNEIYASIIAKNVKISALNTQKTYGEIDNIQISYQGVISGEKLIGNLTRESGENVGQYEIIISQEMKNQNSNYNLILEGTSRYTISKREFNISIENNTKPFGSTDPEIIYTYDNSQFCFSDNFDVLMQGCASRTEGEEIGRYQYNIGTFELGKNYQINLQSAGMLTIVKKDITITAVDCQKVYGEQDPTLEKIETGTIQGVPSQIVLKRESGENVGEYKITYKSLDDSHYNIEFICGKFQISPRDITVKAEDCIKYYGSQDPQPSFVLTSGMLVGDDTLEDVLVGEITREQGEDVGTYYLQQGNLNTNANYNLTFEGGALKILVQQLVIKFDNISKIYGDEDPEFTYTITSGMLKDGDSFKGKPTRVYGENIGEYLIDAGSMSLNQNYSFNYSCGILEIKKRPIEITANNVAKTYGDEDPEFTYTITSGNVVKQDDLLGNIYRNNVGVKIYENVGEYELLCGLANPNYSITYISGTLNIQQRQISIVSTNYQSVYGQPVITTFDYQIQGEIIEGDNLVGNLYKTGGEDAGVYTIKSSFSLGRNYKINYNPSIYTICPVELVVKLGDYSKTYGAIDPNYSVNIIEGELVGTDVLDYEIDRESNENIGKYILSCKSLDTNYNITTIESSLTIEKKEVFLNIEVLNKAYDGTNVCYVKNPVVSGLVDNEIILDYDKNNCATFAQVEPGDQIPVTLHDFNLIGTNAQNYNLNLPTNLVADITYSSLTNKNITVSTYNSTAMKVGTTMNVESLNVEENYNGKKVVCGFNVDLNTKNGDDLVLDRALTMAIKIDNLNNYNNIRVYGKNSKGEYESISYQISGNNIVVSTSSFGEFMIVCDDEDWIDIALAVCIGLLLGFVLAFILLRYRKKVKINNKK